MQRKFYMPVPYNVAFELSIMSKLSDDALQILEQIVPYFQPSFNITINLISSIGEKKIYRLFWKVLITVINMKVVLNLVER